MDGNFPNGLAAAMRSAGVGPTELARQSGTSKQNIDRWAGQSRRLTAAWAAKLAPLLRTSPSALLLLGEGEPVRVPLAAWDPASPEADAESPQPAGVSTVRPYRGHLAGASPYIDVSAGAGPGGLPLPAAVDHKGVVYSADAVRGEILLPQYLLSEFTRAAAARVHWVAVRGDSMTPTLWPGERVMVDTTDTAIGQGGVFVLRDPDGEVLVKRLRKLSGNRIELVSDNERQGNAIHGAEDVAIIGRVVGRLGRV